jgi:hypothetical protein
MKRLLIAVMTLLLILSFTSCSRDTALSPVDSPAMGSADVEQIALEMVAETGWPTDPVSLMMVTEPDGRCPLIHLVSREQVTENIAHYHFEVITGEGDYDRIGLHRVVRERRPYRPIRARKSIMFQHGDVKDFVGVFLPGVNQPNTPDDFGIAVHLAAEGIDVWGIDQAWTLVPTEETDFTFMADWGMQRQVDDARIAMGVARFVRCWTGSGFGKMIFSGFSSGVWTGYALLNHETQLPYGRRHVRGFIPVDGLFKTDDPIWSAMGEGWVASYGEMLAAGIYNDTSPFPLFSSLARTDPDGDSPLVPGFTNLQAALWLGIGQIFSEEVATHYLAGIWEEGMPVGLQFMSIEEWLDFMEFAPPYEALLFEYDLSMILAGDETPFDDYLGEITVPVFNVAAAGGLGEATTYTMSLLGSDDTEALMIQLFPDEDILTEFGHVDLFTAYNAPELVWEPILDWIEDH